MNIAIAETMVQAFSLYFALGFIFAIVFLVSGVGRIDPAARGAGIGFKLIIMPGLCLFWPLMLYRWIAKKLPPVEQNAHRKIASEDHTEAGQGGGR